MYRKLHNMLTMHLIKINVSSEIYFNLIIEYIVMKTKYFIIIIAVICLLIFYYFYDEIANIKKSFIPLYQKTMQCDAKIYEIEKARAGIKLYSGNSNDTVKQIASPIYSISYQSDMVNKAGKGANVSLEYMEVTESEAKRLLDRINQNKSITSPRNSETSDVNHESTNNDTEVVNVKISDLLRKDDDKKEFQNILTGLTKNDISNICSENFFEDEDALDQHAIKNLSESLHRSRQSGDDISDIPSTSVKKPTRKSRK
jgi:hypothetical protein